MPLTVTLPDSVPLDVGDWETLELAETVTETVEQPELVKEGELETDKLGLPEGLCEPLVVPLIVTLPDTVPLDVGDCETLELAETVTETVEQPELVKEDELVTDKLGLPEGLREPLVVPLIVTLPDSVPLDVGDWETLELAETVTETVEQPELVKEGELETDKLGLPEGL